MSLEKIFKKSILAALNQYEIKQQHISIDEAQAISNVRQLVDEINSVIRLRQELICIINKLPSRFFSFLPFVIDLRKDLRDVLYDPQYSLDCLFTFEATTLREENDSLRSKLINLEFQSRSDHVQQSATDTDLYKKIAVLEKEFAQSNQLLRIENRELIQQFQQTQNKNTVLHETLKNLQSQVGSADSKMVLLQRELSEKNAEIKALRAENEMLKRDQKDEAKENKKYGFWGGL